MERGEREFLRKRVSTGPLKNGIVTFQHFKKFCKWWAPTLTTLITVSGEWQSTDPVLVHGFVGRAAAEALLKAEKGGVFLIRFSESRPGWLAITFNEKPSHGTPDHCLVEVTQTGFTLLFKDKAKHTHPTLSSLVDRCPKLETLAGGNARKEAFASVVRNYATVDGGESGSREGESRQGESRRR